MLDAEGCRIGVGEAERLGVWDTADAGSRPAAHGAGRLALWVGE
jgi:hypothetical protein